MDDLISRKAAIDEIEERKFANRTVIPVVSELNRLEGYVMRLPSAQPEPDWNEIMVICDNCGHAVHAKRENCKVSAQPEIIRCKDCIHYHDDVWGDEIGIGKPYDSLIVGHNGCDKWCGDKKDMVFTSSEGYCFLAERREDEQVD